MRKSELNGARRRATAGVPEAVVAARLVAWQADGAEHAIRAVGSSMLPLIGEGDRLYVTHNPQGVRRGDVIVFRSADGLVAHRVLRAGVGPEGGSYLTQGDHTRQRDAECGPGEFVGRVLRVDRDGQARRLDGLGWRAAGWAIAILMLHGGAWDKCWRASRCAWPATEARLLPGSRTLAAGRSEVAR